MTIWQYRDWPVIRQIFFLLLFCIFNVEVQLLFCTAGFNQTSVYMFESNLQVYEIYINFCCFLNIYHRRLGIGLGDWIWNILFSVFALNIKLSVACHLLNTTMLLLPCSRWTYQLWYNPLFITHTYTTPVSSPSYSLLLC